MLDNRFQVLSFCATRDPEKLVKKRADESDGSEDRDGSEEEDGSRDGPEDNKGPDDNEGPEEEDGSVDTSTLDRILQPSLFADSWWPLQRPYIHCEQQ